VEYLSVMKRVTEISWALFVVYTAVISPPCGAFLSRHHLMKGCLGREQMTVTKIKGMTDKNPSLSWTASSKQIESLKWLLVDQLYLT
jgi:hypothetical protein